MRSFKTLAAMAVVGLGLALAPAHKADAQVSVGIGVGGYGPPACQWGYYNYAPYACAPYGYYGPEWFNGGVFIGAGPWYHRGFYGRGYYGGRGFYRGGYRGGVAFR